MQLRLKDFKRFEKQIILKNVGVVGQKKILKAKVLIIGIGGLGCPLLTYLAASGVGTIGIADPDKVEISNLNRQTLFTTNDIGKYKVDQAKSSIKRVNNKIRIKIFKKKVISKNIKSIIKDFDKYDNQKFIYKNFESKNEIKLNDIIRFVYFMIFFWCLFTIFLNREYLDKKKSLFIPFLASFILLIYSLVIGTNSMTQYNNLFGILALFIFSLVFIKYYKYE